MIFADSSYFIALAREKDRWHKDAVRISDRVRESMIVSELIISESITMVGSFEGGKSGKTLYEYFIDNCKIEFMNEGIMKKYGVKKIISFDGDFDKADEIERIK